MDALRVVIADDEPLIRLGLRTELAAIRDVEVVAECANGADAIAAVRSLRPDVVFLDIHMPEPNGLEVARRVGLDHSRIVFVTAYDAYAIQAFEVQAVDYLLKPFDGDRVRASIERVWSRLNRCDRFVVRIGGRYELVPIESVDWVEAADNYVALHCGSKIHLVRETLCGIARRLGRDFLRVHRGRIVRVDRIVAVRRCVDETYELEMHNGTRLTTGRQFKRAVLSLIR